VTWARTAALLAALALSACGASDDDGTGAAPTSTSAPAPSIATTGAAAPAPPPAPATTAAAGAVLVAAGDVASCSSRGDEATAGLLDARPAATVAVLGDSVYERGTPSEFADCYAPTWGRHKARTRPAAGNHEYATPRAAAYYAYFGEAAGDPGTGYYSYDLGPWHVVVANSNCEVVSCAAGSAQERWLRADLAAHPAACTLAYWHHPRFSSGAGHGSDPATAPIFSALYEGGADVVLAGHDHNYERFEPLEPKGALDQARGIRSFVVGTGGRSHYGFREPPLTGSAVRNSDTFGVLALTLRPEGYDWEFVPIPGWTFSDRGSGTCH
jgi:hypothetical protein